MRHATVALLLLIVTLLAGCGTAAMPVIQAAGMFKTAYDYSEWVMPRKRVDFMGDQSADRRLEENVRRRLQAEQIQSPSLGAYAMNGHVYLVGVFETQTEAQRARQAVRDVKGVRRLTCSFFRPSDAGQYDPMVSRELAKTIASQLEADEQLESAWLRVSVQQQNVVLMGRVQSPDQKERVESLVRDTEGAREIRSYVAVNS